VFQHIKIQNFDYMGVSVSGTSDNLVFANMESDGMVPYGTTPHGFYVNAPNSAFIQFLNDEGMCANKSGAEKKDAAMSFLQNALAMSDAIAAREIIQPEQFKNGISQIIDGVVLCMNASTWAKGEKPPRLLPGISREDPKTPHHREHRENQNPHFWQTRPEAGHPLISFLCFPLNALGLSRLLLSRFPGSFLPGP